jgi:hypothetical protein
MLSGARGLMSKISSKFFHEVVPVALASVIGTMLINHYSRQPVSPSVVVQAPQPPGLPEAILRTLHEEHELIISYLQRDADAKRAADAAQSRAASAATASADRALKVRQATVEKATPLPPPRPEPEKRIAVRDLDAAAPGPASVLLPARSETVAAAEPSPAPDSGDLVVAKREGVVPMVRDWIVNVAEAPARAIAPRLFDDPPTPPTTVPVVSLQVTHQ